MIRKSPLFLAGFTLLSFFIAQPAFAIPSLAPTASPYTYDVANRLLTAGSVTYAYDKVGNRLT